MGARVLADGEVDPLVAVVRARRLVALQVWVSGSVNLGALSGFDVGDGDGPDRAAAGGPDELARASASCSRRS